MVRGDGMSITEQKEDTRRSIGLPEFERVPDQEMGVSGMYGATAVAAAYCGFHNTPGAVRGYWAHGWYPSFRPKLHPDLILGIRTNPNEYYWVARKDEEDYLRGFGYSHVSAIGLPLVYLPLAEIRRRPGTLLVMPAHSIEYTTHNWKFDEYAEAIAAIRSEFTEVVACIHPVCWKRGYWVGAFRKLGLPVIEGAVAYDRKGLKRVQRLMSSFEYVTTNGFGSQLAYAAYFGAKPSVYGSYATFRVEDFKNDPLYVRHAELLESVIRAISEEELRRNIPQLFCHPREAKAGVEWARFELGEQNKVSPRRMRSLFGWNASARVGRSLQSKIPGRVKHWARIRRDPLYREANRLMTMPRYQPTRTTLLGPTLEVQDGLTFILKKQALFDEEIYRFVAVGDPPRIIDCGAGIGLSVCYFKKLYPECEITAFEPDPRIYEILKRNCDSWGSRGVRLIPRAVWNCETTIAFVRHENIRGRISEGAAGGDAIEVRTCRLRDYLRGRIDLLRISVEGAEVDVLLDCSDLLGQVQNLVVNYRSIFERPQRLDTLMTLLTKAGFRMHFHSWSASRSPLLYREINGSLECKLSIFAFRE
jgi:FkbM family methyltransferase